MLKLRIALAALAIAGAGWVFVVTRPIATLGSSELLAQQHRFDPQPSLSSWASLCPPVKKTDPNPIETTLCEAMEHPAQFACHRIVVHATYSTDCFERAALIDGRCGAPESGGPSPPSMGAFLQGVCADGALGRPRSAEKAGTFVARLLWWHSTPLSDLFEVEILDASDAK